MWVCSPKVPHRASKQAFHLEKLSARRSSFIGT
uniref:Uncharacterized protein n=1 Tax=Arundo donax TaxID=35708 RepID=A0A0A9B5K9_ARUDO